MSPDKPRITARIAGYPLHPLTRPFAIGYFFAVCACDLVYSQASVFVQNDSPEFASITPSSVTKRLRPCCGTISISPSAL